MRKISAALGKIVGGYRPEISLNLLLKSVWDDVVGQDLVDVTEFVEAKYIGSNKISVCIKVLNSAIIFARHAEKNIVYAIEKLTSIPETSLVFRLSQAILHARPKEVSKAEKQVPNIGKGEDFANATLKDALEQLKCEVIGASDDLENAA
jgi:hypothetical protein